MMSLTGTLQSAVKRALEQSMNSEITGNTSQITSTPKSAKHDNKRSRLTNLDASVSSAVEDFVSDSINDAVNSVNSSGEIGAKNKKIAEAVLKNLQPILIAAIQKTLDSFFSEVVQHFDQKISKISAAVQKSALLSHYHYDKLEQYSRRENVRISGISVNENDSSEVLQKKVCDIAKSIDVDLEPSDFTACHGVGDVRKQPKQVLCRLDKGKKFELMHNKKKLKNKSGSGTGSRIYVNEDLTPLRVKMLKLVKEKFRGAYTVNGKIIVYQDGKRCTIDSPDDLFQVGIDLDDNALVGLGLKNCLINSTNIADAHELMSQ